LNSKANRAVGSAMAKNANLIVIPCHRVVRSNGEIGQYALGAD
jgi:O-6-methylguanine DNA methyltransferase